jgi:hypothetical protein
VTYLAWATTLAPILINFSRSVASVQDGNRSKPKVTYSWDVLKDGAHLGSFPKRADAVVFIAGQVTGSG